MKILTITLGAMLIIAFVGNYANANSARVTSSTPELVIKDFYKWYITAVEGGVDPFKTGKPTLKKYVTLRLIKQIENGEVIRTATGTEPTKLKIRQ